MRTQCCVACCSLPVLLILVAVLAGFLLIAPHNAPLTAAWQETPARVQAEILADREALRLEFTEVATEQPRHSGTPCLLWAQRTDEYGRFRRVSSWQDEAARVPAR